MVTADDVRRLVRSLPGTEQRFVRDREKYRVGPYVYLTFARDELSMGLAFPKDERASAVEAEPEKFQLPSTGDMRYNWIRVMLDALDETEMHELVVEAWRMCAPKRLRDSYQG